MEQIMKMAIEGLDVDYAEIRIERSETTSISYLGPVLEDIAKVFTLGGCVRICMKGGWGFASFNRIENVPQSVKAAYDMAFLTAGERAELAPVQPVKASLKNKVSIDPSQVTLEEKCELVKRYNNLMLNDEEIVTTKAEYRDTKKCVWFHSTSGTMLRIEKIYTGVSFMAVAKDGTNVQRGMKSFGDRRGYETVLNLDDEVEHVIKITRDLIRAPKVKSGVYPVILDPQLAGVFVHEAFGHLSEADFVYENPQAREMMKLGRRFGPDFLNIIDDGSLEGENGHIVYDDEGVKKERTYLIKNGQLVGRLHSRETAGRLEEKPTGNARALNFSFRPIVRMTTTFIDSGESSLEKMFADIKDGIYACGFLGGMTDLERFTFSSAYANKIENGRITTPLRDVILSGNVFETLHNITMIGNDLTLFGGLGGCGKGGQVPLPVSDGSPHICVKSVLVG
ncbi:MAG TPA: TldD/PmbA family protein [Anaerolineae bacterium]|nr:TldD/PmbA family protein [Anaerolineae bacterium]